MSLIGWSKDLSVGIPSIDEQHKKLLFIINDLHTAVSDGRGDAVVSRSLGELVQYAAAHFRYEEELFKQTRYPGDKEHEAEHAELSKKLQALVDKLGTGEKQELSEETLQFVLRWFLDHTQVSDKKYSAHLIEHGVK